MSRSKLCLPFFCNLIILFFFMSMTGCKGIDFKKVAHEVETDTYEGRIREIYDRIWYTSKVVLKDGGELTYEDDLIGRMEADFEAYHVVLKLEQIAKEEGLLRIRVYDKQTLEPNVLHAESLFHKIQERVRW